MSSIQGDRNRKSYNSDCGVLIHSRKTLGALGWVRCESGVSLLALLNNTLGPAQPLHQERIVCVCVSRARVHAYAQVHVRVCLSGSYK